MQDPKILKRVVACPGTIQLATVLSVLSYREKQQQLGFEYENYLVIYGLSAPEGQMDAFAALIKQMAERIWDWQAIVYIKPEQTNAICSQLISSSPTSIFRMVHELVGTDSADEIYLIRNWDFENELLINTYQSAQKICYGDSIGLYFSSTSRAFYPVLTEQNNLLRRSISLNYLKARIKTIISDLKENLKLTTSLKTIEFDIGYFVLPDILGELPPMKFVTLPPSGLLEILQKLRSLVDPDYIINLQKIIADAPVSILLTSNFYEYDRMSLENEITAYRQFLISEGIEHDTVLVIKPHPRDNAVKIQKLKDALADLFANVLILSEPNLFFLPFEVFFLAAFLRPDLTLKNNLRVFAVSTACLSLKLLFKVPCIVGFGDKITPKLFYENYAVGRLEHELQLKTAVQKL